MFMKKNASTKQFILFLIYFFGFQFWITTLYLILINKDINDLYSYLNGVKHGILLIITTNKTANA